jgi:hypothetical protein
MASINHTVWKFLAEDISIQKNIERGIINIRGLARHLIKKHNLQTSMDAVISAIRRYETEAIFSDKKEKIDEIFKSAIITTKSNMACITLREYDFEVIAKDFVDKKILKENFRMIKSKERVKIFLNEKDIDQKVAIFSKENVLKVTKGLSEVRVTLPESADETVGILARIGQEIALEEVNVNGMIPTLPEYLIYVKSSDLISAHKALMNLIKETRE